MISYGGRSVPGFMPDGRWSYRDSRGVENDFFPMNDAPTTTKATPVLAAAMVGATVGLLAHVMKASAPVAILTGAGATILAKIGIDRASA